MTAFYNEHDPYAAQYLRNLMAAGLIAPGVVDERDVQEIEAWELTGFTQVHMFAGIGIWSGALRAAGWPDDEPIWTGSCPCQPFSNAGQKKGFSDDRHLWPFWRSLIAECRPTRVAGEQVASKDGRIWLDIVSADLEALDIAFGASDLCAAGFGGAHIRQREYFAGLANTCFIPCERDTGKISPTKERFNGPWIPINGGGDFGHKYGGSIGGLAESNSRKRYGITDPKKRKSNWTTRGRQQGHGGATDDCGLSGMEHADLSGEHERAPSGQQSLCHAGNIRDANPSIRRSRQTLPGYWHDVDWLLCRNPSGEPSWRPVEPGTFPLAHGVADRMGKLRAYGNALDFEAAKGFCEILVEICLGL